MAILCQNLTFQAATHQLYARSEKGNTYSFCHRAANICKYLYALLLFPPLIGRYCCYTQPILLHANTSRVSLQPRRFPLLRSHLLLLYAVCDLHVFYAGIGIVAASFFRIAHPTPSEVANIIYLPTHYTTS